MLTVTYRSENLNEIHARDEVEGIELFIRISRVESLHCPICDGPAELDGTGFGFELVPHLCKEHGCVEPVTREDRFLRIDLGDKNGNETVSVITTPDKPMEETIEELKKKFLDKIDRFYE